MYYTAYTTNLYYIIVFTVSNISITVELFAKNLWTCWALRFFLSVFSKITAEVCVFRYFEKRCAILLTSFSNHWGKLTVRIQQKNVGVIELYDLSAWHNEDFIWVHYSVQTVSYCEHGAWCELSPDGLLYKVIRTEKQHIPLLKMTARNFLVTTDIILVYCHT